MIRPSSLPMLDKCPCFISSQSHGAADKSAGTMRHLLARAYLERGEAALAGVDEDEAEKVRWACRYLQDHAPMLNYPLRIEERRAWISDDTFEEIIAGTPDATCGPVLFDFKSRHRDYEAQMAAYVILMCLGTDWKEVKIHLLFMELGREVVYTLTLDRAKEIVADIIYKASVVNPQPQMNDYCGWCVKNLTCPALLKPAAQIAEARGAVEADVKLFNEFIAAGAHPSAIENADMMGVVLRIMRCVKKACESAEHHAKELAEKQGIIPTGFNLGTRQGKMFVTDAAQAFSLSGLPQDRYLRACSPRLNTSKTYPDQIGIVDLYTQFTGLKKSVAKKQLLEKLQPVIKQGNPSVTLRAASGIETEEEE